MTISSNGSGEFKVLPVGTVKDDLKRLHREQMLKGMGGDFLRALAKINARLRKAPREFGESLYRLPALKLVVYQAIIDRVVATYGVHDELPIVFVHVVNLLSNPND
jgi:hypothetical protein